MNMDKEIIFTIDECVYIKYFNLDRLCTLFDYNIDNDLLCSNIKMALSEYCLEYKENQKINIEIPEWEMNYDVILKENTNTYLTEIEPIDDTLGYEMNSNESHSKSTMYKSDTKIWTKLATKLLIENRGDLEHEFNGNKKNYKIWEKISDRLKESGIAITGPNCNTKFRNLMATFKDNVQRANKSGESAINWEYYDIMKQYFGKKDSVAPKKNTLLQSSLPNSKRNGNELHEPNMPLTTDIEINIHEEQIMPPKKKKKNFQEVLLEEIKEDRKSRDAFQSKLENFMDELIQIEKAKLEKKQIIINYL